MNNTHLVYKVKMTTLLVVDTFCKSIFSQFIL